MVKGTGPNLMGRDWLHHIRLDWHRLHSIQTQPQALESILQKYEEVFKEELGEIKRFQANLHVNPDQSPRFYRPRPVPYALRDRVEKELARLEKLKVIEPTQFSDWAVPIVPVVKNDGSIRICGDYKLTVNLAAQLDNLISTHSLASIYLPSWPEGRCLASSI